MEDLYGEIVMLVRKTFEGKIHHEYLPVMVAVAVLVDDTDNGTLYKSGRIYSFGHGDDGLPIVNLGAWDRSP